MVAAIELALTQGPVLRFLIRCDPDNHASAGVARRLGFRYVGRIAEPDGWKGDRYARDPGAAGSRPAALGATTPETRLREYP